MFPCGNPLRNHGLFGLFNVGMGLLLLKLKSMVSFLLAQPAAFSMNPILSHIFLQTYTAHFCLWSEEQWWNSNIWMQRDNHIISKHIYTLHYANPVDI